MHALSRECFDRPGPSSSPSLPPPSQPPPAPLRSHAAVAASSSRARSVRTRPQTVGPSLTSSFSISGSAEGLSADVGNNGDFVSNRGAISPLPSPNNNRTSSKKHAERNSPDPRQHEWQRSDVGTRFTLAFTHENDEESRRFARVAPPGLSNHDRRHSPSCIRTPRGAGKLIRRRKGASANKPTQRGPLYSRDFTIEWPVNRPHTSVREGALRLRSSVNQVTGSSDVISRSAPDDDDERSIHYQSRIRIVSRIPQ